MVINLGRRTCLYAKGVFDTPWTDGKSLRESRKSRRARPVTTESLHLCIKLKDVEVNEVAIKNGCKTYQNCFGK